MTTVYDQDRVTVHHGDALTVLRTLPPDSVDTVATDPPYGLADHDTAEVVAAVAAWLAGDREHVPDGHGFMGRAWDAFVPPPAVWDECLRVLKPGGHLFVFAGSRTQDLMACSIRLAGFQLRDTITWLYASGFPKSRDVTDAMTKYLSGEPLELAQATIRPGVYTVTAFLRQARDTAGWNNRQIDALFDTNGMAGHWTSQASQPAVPSLRQWQVLKDALGFDDSVDELVADLAASERPEDWGTGPRDNGQRFLGSLATRDGPLAGTVGWGTALKPAYEPIITARKPVQGSVTANVRVYGTGGLNVDGCRVPMNAKDRENFARGSEAWVDHSERAGLGRKASDIYGSYAIDTPQGAHEGGRWPSNLILSHAPTCGEKCEPGCPVDDLDRQSGASPAKKERTGRVGGYNDNGTLRGPGAGSASPADYVGTWPADGGGGASRFFPTFRYEPKADTAERPVTVDGLRHPTVKPLDLMRWLVRLATPPGGTVLEPFAGSGTTVEACISEGFGCVAVEREPCGGCRDGCPDYQRLIRQRIDRRRDPASYLASRGELEGTLFAL